MKIAKYKFLNKLKGNFKLSKRILNFKRPKWNLAKKVLLKRKKKRQIDVFKQSMGIGWEKSIKNFKTKIDLGRSLLVYNNYNKRKKSKVLQQKFIQKEERINTIFLKRFFEPEYFLSSVFIANSPNESKKYQDARKIYKNETLYTENEHLRKGDLLSLENKVVKFRPIRKRFNTVEHFSSFYEYDYYSQSFFILKNFEEIDEKDIYLSLTDTI